MRRKDYLDFLRQNLPIPENPTPETVDRFREANNYFYENPDPECVPLLLRSFSNWEDLAAFEAVQSTLRRHPSEIVLEHLPAGLTQGSAHARSWCADTAVYFPDPKLVPYLVELLEDPEIIVRLPAAAALERINTPEVKEIAARFVETETDEEIRDVFKDILGEESDE